MYYAKRRKSALIAIFEYRPNKLTEFHVLEIDQESIVRRNASFDIVILWHVEVWKAKKMNR